MINPNAKKTKASPSQVEKFLWGIVRFRLMPITCDNKLGEDKVVLVESLMSRFKLNFGEIITDENKIRDTILDNSYLFPCLITKLCEAVHVSIIQSRQ